MLNRRTFGLGAAASLAACATAPASAEPVREAGFIDINGSPQWIAVRGDDARKPVLLWLHGGPGVPMSPAAPLFFDWERDFLVAMWDQPGGGATGAKNADNPGAMTLDRFARDGIAVAEHLRRRFGKRKIVLMGISWGTQLGVEMVHRRPEMFAAYVGTAQVTGPRGIRMGYDMALADCRKRGDAAGVAALEKVGPPPYATFQELLVRQQHTNPPGQPMSAREAALGPVNAAMMREHALEPGFLPPPMPAGAKPAPTFIDTVRAVMMAGSKWEIRDYGRDWRVPVFVFQGGQDFNAPEPLAREWVGEIRAPKKGYDVIAGAGHNTVAFHDDLLALLKKHGVADIAARAG